MVSFVFFFFNDTATTEIYTLSLHGRSSDLPLIAWYRRGCPGCCWAAGTCPACPLRGRAAASPACLPWAPADRKSTRLNSSHSQISYAVFCLKKKTKTKQKYQPTHYLARPTH